MLKHSAGQAGLLSSHKTVDHFWFNDFKGKITFIMKSHFRGFSMLKKVLVLTGAVLFISACVITSPAELFYPTPTICVECVQATICAENATGDACPVGETVTPASVLPTLILTVDDSTPTPGPSPTNVFSTTAESTPTNEFTPTDKPAPTEEKMSEIEPTSEDILETAIPENTEISSNPLIGTVVPNVNPTVDPGLWLYKSQTGSPKYTKNFAHPANGCSWSGIAGQVFGPGGVPQSDIVVVVTGDANGTPIDLTGFTGSAIAYGAGAYEVEFPTGPIKTKDSMVIQLFDLEGNELTPPLLFDTYVDCNKNLVVFNFDLSK
jgi:hypothetical protein